MACAYPGSMGGIYCTGVLNSTAFSHGERGVSGHTPRERGILCPQLCPRGAKKTPKEPTRAKVPIAAICLEVLDNYGKRGQIR